MKNTLILGASLDDNTYSNRAIRKLITHKHPVQGIGRRKGFIEGAHVGTEKISINDLDTISMYLNAMNQRGYYSYILELNPDRVIFNPGSENEELEGVLESNGIAFERACTLVLLGLNQY